MEQEFDYKSLYEYMREQNEKLKEVIKLYFLDDKTLDIMDAFGVIGIDTNLLNRKRKDNE